MKGDEIVAILKMITTYHPTKAGNNATLKKGVDYILNPKKTQNGLYTGALNCSVGTALDDMVRTKQFYGKDSSNPKSRTGYHWTISWSPEEHVDYHAAMDIVREFCEKLLKDYECVYSVHTDQAHTHCHLVFNSVNYQNGKKFRYEDGDWAKIFQPELDRLCKERGLHTLEQDTGMTNEEYFKEHSQNKNPQKKKEKYRNKNSMSDENNYDGKNGKEIFHRNKNSMSDENHQRRNGNNKYYNEKNEEYTQSDVIRKDVDDAILSSHSLNEFFALLESWGYKIRHGKSEKYGDYFALTGRGMRTRRNYALGKGYSLESIKKRIEIKNNPLPEYNVPVQPDMRQFIVKYVYWKKYNDDSILAKRICILMYRQGILNKDRGKRPNYYEIKNSIKKIREYERNIELIHEYHIGDAESADAALDKIAEKVSELDNSRKDIYVKRKPYKDLLNTYNELKKVEMGFYAYKNGLEEYKEQHDKYVELKETLDKYGFSENDIEKYQEEIKAELKSISSEKRQLKKKMNSINGIKDFINERNINIPEIEQEYANIPDPDTYEEKQKKELENYQEHSRSKFIR